jgi:pimeloyl-ACP methyl ester carboxylesterase
MAASTRILEIAGAAAAGAAALGAYALYARRYIRRFENIDLASVDVPGSFIEIDGRRIHYVDAGKGDPIVLIHGWNGSTFSMRYVIPELAQRHRVIAIDLLGYGFSERPSDGDYSIAGLGTLVAKVMDALGVERAAILGHSMGGAVVMWFAIHYPERVDKLILVDSATVKEMFRGRNLGIVWRPFAPLFAPLLLGKRTVRRVLRWQVHDPSIITPDVVEGHTRPLRVKGHMRAQLKQLADRRKDVPFDPAQIRAPALILWGEHDRLVPLSRGEELARLIPNSKLIVIRSSGHLPMEEQPELVNRELQAFLDGAQDTQREQKSEERALEPAG